MRSFLIGLFAGILLSALRAPVGLELLQVPASSGGGAMAFRAAALLVVAVGLILGLRSARVSVGPVAILFGASIGYWLHWWLNGVESPYALQFVLSLLIVTLLIAGHQGSSDVRPRKGRIVLLLGAALSGWFLIDMGFPEGHGETVGVGLLGLISLATVGRCTGKDEPLEADGGPPNEALPSGGLSGIAVCGAGIALTLEGLARNTRLLGGGLAADDSVFGTVFLGFALISAVAFTRNIKSAGNTSVARVLVGSCTALVSVLTLRSLVNLSSDRGLHTYIANSKGTIGELLPFSSMDLDLSMHGMIEYDLAIAGPLLVLPGFLAGAMVGLLRKPVELAALLVGAAGGLALLPRLLEFEWSASGIVQESSCSSIAMYGALLAGVGALLLALTSKALGRTQRIVGGVAAIAAIATGQFVEAPSVKMLSPWEKRVVSEVISHDIPAGFLTVELDPDGQPFATLNRRPLSPNAAQTPLDLDRIRMSWAMLGEIEADSKPSVLFVGQLNPARALALVDLGAGTIDRSAAWSDAMPMLEQQLFDGNPNWFPGKILSIASARARLAAGEYDLVIVPAVKGCAPTTRNLASTGDATVVVWFDAGAGLETQYMGEGVLLSAPGLTEMYAAIAHGPRVQQVVAKGGWGAPRLSPIADPLPPAPMMQVLNMRKNRRGDFHRARFANRLASAERSPSVGAGLAAHFNAQTASSPFTSEIDRIELVDEANQKFSHAAAGAEPSALSVELIETLAHLLRAQRMVEEMDRYLIPPAERHSPWPALEIALSQASLEYLEPEAAVESLTKAHATGYATVDSLAMLADAQSQVGDFHGAARSLDQALVFAPHHAELERRLAMTLARAGDARASDVLRHALEDNPDDEELKGFLEMGPLPAPAAGYHPLISSGAHDHGQH